MWVKDLSGVLSYCILLSNIGLYCEMGWWYVYQHIIGCTDIIFAISFWYSLIAGAVIFFRWRRRFIISNNFYLCFLIVKVVSLFNCTLYFLKFLYLYRLESLRVLKVFFFKNLNWIFNLELVNSKNFLVLSSVSFIFHTI